MKKLPDCKNCKYHKSSKWRHGRFLNADCTIENCECKFEKDEKETIDAITETC